MTALREWQMIKKFASKFVSDILPSVAATVIGAYVVTHYINKPATPPPAAAATSVAEPAKESGKAEALAAPDKSSKPAKIEKSEPADLASLPEPTRAKADKPVVDKSAAEKTADKSDKRPHQPVSRDKVVKASPPPAEAVATPEDRREAKQEERRDANELARAAIERLRGPEPTPASVSAPRPADIARATPEAPQAAPPLQPAITVAAPVATYAAPVSSPASASTDVSPLRLDPAQRMSPPAEIPASRRPVDLRADAAPWEDRPTVTGNVLSAAKSVFNAILPR
jgi:hypothetical protein